MAIRNLERVARSDLFWNKLDPSAFPTYFANRDLSPRFVKAIDKLAGEETAFAFGYGSSFTGEPSASALSDIMLITYGGTWQFHRRNTNQRPNDYGWPRSAMVHAGLNTIGPNFYLTKGDMGKIKYGVMGSNLLLDHVGIDQDSGEASGLKNLYMPGRLQKAVLVPVLERPGHTLDMVKVAINQSRIEGVLLALSAIHSGESTSLRQLSYRVAQLSYDADRRVEAKNKSQRQVDLNPLDFDAMHLPIVEQFLDTGIIERVGEDQYKPLIVLPPETLPELIASSKDFAGKVNMTKNWKAMGVVKGLAYQLDKTLRVKASPQIYDRWSQVVWL